MIRVHFGNSLKVLQKMDAESIDFCFTSPPYWNLRNYQVEGQLGLESTPEEYVSNLCDVLDGVGRVLKLSGSLLLNIGDGYAHNRSYQVSDSKHKTHDFAGSNAARIPEGMKAGDLIGIPWMVAFEMRKRGWYWRQEIVWEKPNCMPESVKNRCGRSHEQLLHFAKSKSYYWGYDDLLEPCTAQAKKCGPNSRANTDRVPRSNLKQDMIAKGTYVGFNDRYKHRETRNSRDVWRISVKPFKGSHCAAFPPELAEKAVAAGCPLGGVVLDPFAGTGTVGLAARNLNRDAVLIELNDEYLKDMNLRMGEGTFDVAV